MVNLKGILSGKEKKGEHYWSIVVEPGWVQAGVWTIKEGKVDIVSTSPPTPWQEDSELIGTADSALASAIQNLPEDAKEPSKTVFGVSTTWVKEGEIEKDYLEKLKKLCSKLSLEPTGFVILPEAIVNYIKTEEGSPLSGIVVGVTADNLEVSVFKLGKITGTSLVARSVSVIDDVCEGLARFVSSEVFPSRIVLYNGKEGELEEVRQALLKVAWDDLGKVKFLHTPKIEIFSPEKKVLAVSLAGASEMADVTQILKTDEAEDVLEDGNLVSPKKGIRAEDVGFVIGQDIAKVSAVEKKEEPQEIKEVVKEEKDSLPRRFPSPKSLLPLAFFRKIKSTLSGIIANISGNKVTKMDKKKKLIIFGTTIVTIIIGTFLAWWYLPKATITIFVAPKKLDEKITLFVDPNAASVDFSEKVLPGEVLGVSESGEKTKSTTGTKTIGERAKGSVEVRNGTSSNINLTSGTVIVSSNNLEFELTESASVSAALSPSTPGTATVEVAATDIGSEYNMAEDESFKVANYPKAEVDAVAVSDFSGGSSKQISAVDEDDQETLLEDLEDELDEKAKREMRQLVNDKTLFLEGSLKGEIVTKDFSDKVGDEADTLKLSLTIDYAGLSVDRLHLFDLAQEVLKDKIPQGYVLYENQIDISFVLEEEEGGVYELEASLEANLLPEVKPDEIAEKIAGKYPPLAQDFLVSIPGFTRAQIDVKPKFPGRLGIIPKVIKNITIEVTAER